MRIVIDMQGAQTSSRFRGIGRYTLSLTRAIVRQPHNHEIILALNGQHPEAVDHIRKHFDGLLPARNIVVWQNPPTLDSTGTVCEAAEHIAERVREAFLLSLRPDVIHINSLFEGFYEEAITSIGVLDKVTPVTVTIYDLIPLLNPDQYLQSHERQEKHYWRKIEFLKKASHFFSISEYSKQEATEALGISTSSVTNIFGAIDESLSDINHTSLPDSAHLVTMGIVRPFILHTGGGDERKNLPRLIEAFARLPAKLRASHQLVFAGRMPPVILNRLEKCVAKTGLRPDELVFTQYISDAALARLYIDCALYVFPSRHEGLGLPAMEAMAFGAPVIAANTTSLPEVVVKTEGLFDPFDVDDICAKICEVLENKAFRDELISHGTKRAKQFSWDESARRTIQAWENLAQTNKPPMRSWFDIQTVQASLYRQTIDSLSRSLSNHLEDVDLKLLAMCLAENEKQTLSFFRRQPLATPIRWRVEGPFDSSCALALVNREIARGLAAYGQMVSLHSTEGPGDFLPNHEFLETNPDIKELYKRSLSESPLDAEVCSRNTYPPRVLDLNSRLNFLHAYGWEESGFPMQWVSEFNQALQGMTVMSEHVRKIMIDHGVTVPIAISALGVDHWDAIEADPNYRLDAKAFRFLHVSSCLPRSGVDTLLRAYGRAFSASDDVSLVIKIVKNPQNDAYEWLKLASNENPDFPHVVIIEEDFSDPALKALYEQCNVLVAPSRAEGFGLPMAEAMLSNLAVITTAWGGQVDFCSEETAWLVDYSFARANTHFGISSSVWADPKEDHLCALMKDVYLLPETKRAARIQAGQGLLRAEFNWRQVASRVLQSATQYAASKMATKPRIGWVSTWNTGCSVTAYSKYLLKHFPTDVTLFAAHTHAPLSPDEQITRRCWQEGEDDPLFNLLMEIEEAKLDVVVIQFDYSFFNFDYFADFIDQVVLAGHVVVVTLHATMDPQSLPHKRLQKLAASLNRCHRLLVHTPADMNRLKEIGLVNNVTLFPHGVIRHTPAEKPTTKSGDVFVLASYGFFLPNKGLIELIEAVAILHAQGKKCRLLMANAQYSADESTTLINAARERINELDLASHISLCTDYLEDEKSLQILEQADLIVFPYQNTGESASGAVRFGIASGRPVAVTPLPIFDDVQNVVHTLPGITPADIAQGIASLADASNNFAEPFAQQEKRTQDWLCEHDHSRVGQRLHMMLNALHNDRLRNFS